MQLFSLLAAQWVQRRRILLTSNQVSADTHILTHHHRHKQQFSSSVLLPLLPSPFHSRRWPNQRNPSLRSPQSVWSSRADTWQRIARWVRIERRLGSFPLLSYPVFVFSSFPASEERQLSISSHQCSPARVETSMRALTLATARGSLWATTRLWGRLPAWRHAPPASSRSWPTSPTRQGRTPGWCVYSSSAAGKKGEGWGSN